eukprot:g3549.t1
MEKNIKDIHALEKSIESSPKNANDLLKLLKLLDSSVVAERLAALHSTRRLFLSFGKRGDLLPPAKSQTTNKKAASLAVYRKWLRARYLNFLDKVFKILLTSGTERKDRELRVAALRTLMEFVRAERKTRQVPKDEYYFGTSTYTRMIDSIMQNNNILVGKELIDILASEYLIRDDVRLYTFRNLERLFQKSEGGDFSELAFLLLLRTPAPQIDISIDDFWVPISTTDNRKRRANSSLEVVVKRRRLSNGKSNAKGSSSVSSSSSSPKVSLLLTHKQAFEKAWLAFLRQRNIPTSSLKKAMLRLPKNVMPFMQHPLLLCDLLMDAMTKTEKGGVIALLALESLFLLITQHSLDLPDFYDHLYSLVSPALFLVTYRPRVFKLLDICLKSPSLPNYVVASFIKRLARLALSAPPSGALFVLPLIFNLILRHRGCMPLLHKEGKCDLKSDPFDMEAVNLQKTNALESSLWELEALKKHYAPAVASLASVFEQTDLSGPGSQLDVPKGVIMEGSGKDGVVPYPIRDFMKLSYKVLIGQEAKRAGRRKKPPTLTYESHETLFAPLVA